MASEYTPNRRYPLYTDQDKPNLRDQYNQAIREIDADIKTALDDSGDVSDALGTGFDAQHTVRMAIDAANTSLSNLGTAIGNEVTARENADTQLAGNISSEATARANADTQLASDISSEATARANADTQLANADSQLSTDISNEVTARQNADTQLSTDISNEATARANADISLSNRITALEKTEYMVVIGDSFSDPNDGSAVAVMWPTIVANALNLNLRNYAKGGAGFVQGGVNRFDYQLQTAIADIQDANSVKKIYIFGGINDAHNTNLSANDFLAAAESLLSTALTSFPKSEIIVAGVCPTRNADGSDTLQFANGGHRYDIFTEFLSLACTSGNGRSSITNGVKFISLRNFPFLIDSFYQSSNNWHPSLAGHRALASKLMGGDVGHDLANLVNNNTFTRKPTIVDSGNQVIATAIDFDVSIVGSNLACVGMNFSAAALTQGSKIRLNGAPSVNSFAIATFNGDFRLLAANAPEYAASELRIPDSFAGQNVAIKLTYYFGI